MSSSERRNGDKPPREPISITDKRRVDPDTGRVREHKIGRASCRERV